MHATIRLATIIYHGLPNFAGSWRPSVEGCFAVEGKGDLAKPLGNPLNIRLSQGVLWCGIRLPDGLPRSQYQGL